MSAGIRNLLHRKVAKSLKNVDSASNIISYLQLKPNKSEGIYSFLLPLKTNEYNIEDNVKDILNCDREFNLNNVILQKNALSFEFFRDNYIKEVLESNYHSVVPLKFNNNSKTIIVEFSSPNIAKPFHLGHLRSTIIGNYVANINSFLKENVKKINYLGDWGTQYGFVQLGVNIGNINKEDMKTNPIRTLYNAYVSTNKLAESDPSIANQARSIFRELETGRSTTYEEWEKFRKYTVEELTRIYNRINIQFDEYHWESMYNATKIKDLILSMEKKNLLELDTMQRKVIHLNSEKSVPVIKSDGTTLYITRDLAAAIDRFEKYKFDAMYYVVDSTQSEHFKNLIEILKKMNMPWAEKLKHVRYGRVRGMSTRKGTAVFLDDILNETRDIMKEKQLKSPTTKVSLDVNDNSADILGISAVIISTLKYNRQRDYTFDWNTAFDIKGDTGVRLQYAHCRLVNLEENCGATLKLECDPTLLKEPIVDDLVFIIGKFEEAVLKSHRDLEPCILTVYLFQLSHIINKALTTLQIKGEPTELANQRLLLFHTAKNILAQGMKLLGIIPLNRM